MKFITNIYNDIFRNHPPLHYIDVYNNYTTPKLILFLVWLVHTMTLERTERLTSSFLQDNIFIHQLYKIYAVTAGI